MGSAAVLAYVVLTTQSGQELHWTGSPVVYGVNELGTDDVMAEFDAIDRAYRSWNAVANVSYRTTGCTPRDFTSILDVSTGNPKSGEGNVLAWREEDWAHGNGTIAITFTWYSTADGVIGEADMLLNGEDYRWSNGAPHYTDVEAIVAHEAGHYLGLGHPPNEPEATMYATVEQGEIKKRSLEQDDVDGARHLYGMADSGATGVTGTCADSEPNPQSLDEDEDFFGCSAAPGRSPGAGILALFVVLLVRVRNGGIRCSGE